MPSFYKIVPPPGEGSPSTRVHGAYLIREIDDRKGSGGTWLAMACGILCLSIVVALFGVLNGRPLPAVRSFLPVALKDRAAVGPVIPDSNARTPFQTATNPLRWPDLTLMLRTGLSDEEIIAEIAAKQLVVPMGAAQEAALREAGAGARLISYLRAHPLYADAAASTQNATAPKATTVALPMLAAQPSRQTYAAPPVDFAARDRQVASLEARIDELDERIRQIRTNPNKYWYGRDYGVDRQQGMDRYLDQLDKERNDLRRQKWQLEGR